MRHLPILVLAHATLSALHAETPTQKLFEFNRTNLVEAAEKMPDHWYDFRPTAEVRTYRETLGHLLIGLNSVCGKVRGGASPASGDLEKLPKKELIEAAKATFAFCEPAFALPSPTDEQVRLLTTGLYHTGLHYGNLITYMRLRGVVPPETEKAGAKPRSNQPKMVNYVMGFLKKGPKWLEPNPNPQESQKAHLTHLGKMHELGKLVAAGPFLDNTEVRGILIFRGGKDNIEELRALAEQDPSVKAGRLAVELHPWMVQEHILP